MIVKGFKFGMLLQFAVGPMCLLVFQTSASYGLLTGLSLVLSIALVDALFIALSGFGVAALINKKRIKVLVKITGAALLILFGADIIAGAFHVTLLPSLQLFSDISTEHIFLKGILLTASNPLTILFWSGVFTTQVIENNYNRVKLFFFGTGCVLSTLTFLSFIALLAMFLRSFFNDAILQILNICVGVMLLFFAVRLLLKKTEPPTNAANAVTKNK